MKQINIKKWLWLQKEGIIVGAGWGFLAMYTLTSYFPQAHLTLMDKVVLLPIYLTQIVYPALATPLVYILPPVIGACIGALVDMVYKPKQ